MTRFTGTLVTAAAISLLSLVQGGYLVRASGGTRTVQTVALRREACATNGGTTVGTARVAPDDQGGNPGGLEIDVSLTGGLPRTSYTVVVLGTSCQVLFQGGALKTDDSERGDLSVHVPGTVVQVGPSLRVQVSASAGADVITSDAISAV
ncbi:MAG TPA: hypothetical protein VHB98_21625 [Chloroflexota bacterium]|jgi:hypothetical protein|nr:hypothetical protein [Chloroflexota bacterium]